MDAVKAFLLIRCIMQWAPLLEARRRDVRLEQTQLQDKEGERRRANFTTAHRSGLLMWTVAVYSDLLHYCRPSITSIEEHITTSTKLLPAFPLLSLIDVLR